MALLEYSRVWAIWVWIFVNGNMKPLILALEVYILLDNVRAFG